MTSVPISLFFTIILIILLLLFIHHLTQRDEKKPEILWHSLVAQFCPFYIPPTRRKGKVVQVQVKMLLMMMNVPNIYIWLHFLILDHHRLVIKLRGRAGAEFYRSRFLSPSSRFRGMDGRYLSNLCKFPFPRSFPIYNFGSQAVVEERLYFSPSFFFLCYCYCSCSSVRTKDI